MFNVDMTIEEVIKTAKNPQKIAMVFQSVGMHCLGCAMARGETVAEAAMVHGVDVEVLVNNLNEADKD